MSHKIQKKELNDKLSKGYMEMSEINIELAEESLALDNEALSKYVEKLTECD